MSTPAPKDREADRSKVALWLAHPARPPVAGPGPDAAPVESLLLEAVSDVAEPLQRVPLSPLPFRIGRQAGLELALPSYVVSKVHAEIYLQDGHLRVRDLGSRNGTFVNRKTVQDAAVAEGDVLQARRFPVPHRPPRRAAAALERR